MIIRAELKYKQSVYEGEACVVDKVIELPNQRFKQFSRALLADYDFIAESKNAIQCDTDFRHCLLILDAGGADGFLVDPQGYNYARYSAFVSNARSLVTPDMAIDHSYLSSAEPWRDENRDEMLRLTLHIENHADYLLVLPADEEYLDSVKAYLDIDAFSDAMLCDIRFKVPYKRVYQNILISGSAGDVYALGCWAKGDSVPLTSGTSRRFGIVLRFYYSDGTEGEEIASFNPDCNSQNDWQYLSLRAVAKKAYTSMRILMVYESNANVVYYDGIQLYKEEFGHSYVYDADGNVISVTDLQKQTTTYEYKNNDLVKMILPSGAKQTYTYDSYHNVLSATSPEGVVSNFTYDAYGNNTKVTLGSGTKKISAAATYTTNGNQLASITDALGNTTSYGYDAQTGLLNWVQAPGETESTRTNYSYDDQMHTSGVSQNGAQVSYTYSGELVKSISTASGTEYLFDYGTFDTLSSVKIGQRTLVNHTYSKDANHWLARSDYGNGDYVTYDYDSFGRLVGTGYEDNADAVSYAYDNNGNIGLRLDSLSGRSTKYFYDFQDRLMRYEETGDGYSNTVQWGYDDKNNLSSQTQTLNGTTYTSKYAYDENNRITKTTEGQASASYTYDGYGRMTGVQTKSGNNQVVNTTITYTEPSDTSTTGQIKTWNDGKTTYTYTYDAKGNITSIASGSSRIEYEYDALGRLTDEYDPVQKQHYVYSYDDGGNLLSKKLYVYKKSSSGGVFPGTGGSEVIPVDPPIKPPVEEYAQKPIETDKYGYQKMRPFTLIQMVNGKTS